MTIPRNKWCRMASKKREAWIQKKYEVTFDQICSNLNKCKQQFLLKRQNAFILKRQESDSMEGSVLSKCKKCVGPVFKKPNLFPLSEFGDMRKALLKL